VLDRLNDKGYWPAALWALFILILTLLPLPHIPNALSNWDLSLDKMVHFILFAVLGILILKGNANRSKGISGRQLLILGLTILFGALTETMQYFLPDRTFSLADFAADGIGAIFGAIIFYRLN
jgi:VanZ family protein